MQILIHQPTIEQGFLVATYSSGSQTFTHRFELPIQPVNQADPAFMQLCRWVIITHVVYLFNIEYFDEVTTEFAMSQQEVDFFEKLIFHGMAEFRFVNAIPIHTTTAVRPATIKSPQNTYTGPELHGRLLLNGGGKDGLTSGLLLKKNSLPFSLFEIGSGVAQHRIAKVLKTPRLRFKRSMEERRMTGKYQGHWPTSAAIAFSAILTAYLAGIRDVIASNENSANEASLELDGMVINHQYSKSIEFEKDLNALLESYALPLRYFSLMRPFHELQIIALFAQHPELAGSFISCNHGYRSGAWCTRCAKCAFIALAFSSVAPHLVTDIFNDTSILASPALQTHLRELVEPESQKPLECIGTMFECQVAASQIIKDGSIILDETLRAVFEKESAHVTRGQTQQLFKSYDENHFVPVEYAQLLGSARQTLADYASSLGL